MSGFGLLWNYNDARVEEWCSILDKKDVKHLFPENVSILRAVYKKGNPRFANAYNGNSRDFQNFLWEDSSFKKVITPSAQSYLIMDEIMLAKYLYDCSKIDAAGVKNQKEKQFLSILLTNSAVIQGEFLSDAMRNYDGLFVSKADKTENPFGSPELEETGEPPSITDQALAMEAFSMLSSTLNDSRYPAFKDEEKALTMKKWAEEIYSMLLESPEDVFYSKTRDLCNIISACIEYARANQYDKDIINYTTELALELESRLDMSGNLLRYPDENNLTSSTSCFLAIKALVQACRITGIYKFLSAASLLYKKLNLLWDPSCSLYSLDGEDKYKYTLRDVGSVIAGLNALRLFGEEDLREDAQEKFANFFDSAINQSRLIHSCVPPPDMEDCEGYASAMYRGSDTVEYRDFCHPDTPQYLELSVAPVFAKKFTYKPKKRKYSINSSSFYSDYALFTAREMLCTNYPAIDCYCSRMENSCCQEPCSGCEQEDVELAPTPETECNDDSPQVT